MLIRTTRHLLSSVRQRPWGDRYPAPAGRQGGLAQRPLNPFVLSFAAPVQNRAVPSPGTFFYFLYEQPECLRTGRTSGRPPRSVLKIQPDFRPAAAQRPEQPSVLSSRPFPLTSLG